MQADSRPVTEPTVHGSAGLAEESPRSHDGQPTGSRCEGESPNGQPTPSERVLRGLRVGVRGFGYGFRDCGTADCRPPTADCQLPIADGRLPLPRCCRTNPGRCSCSQLKAASSSGSDSFSCSSSISNQRLRLRLFA